MSSAANLEAKSEVIAAYAIISVQIDYHLPLTEFAVIAKLELRMDITQSY
jgi:hypothetical protein